MQLYVAGSRLQIERSCVKNLSTLIAHSAREINVWHHIIPGMIKEEPQVGGEKADEALFSSFQYLL